MSDLFAASKALLRKAMPEKPMTPDQFAEQVADVVEPFIVARIDAEVNAALDRLVQRIHDDVGSDQATMTEPTTEAGKRLLAQLEAGKRLLAHLAECDTCRPFGPLINARNAIAAIEAEARDNQNNADLKAWKQRIQAAAVNAVLDRLAARHQRWPDRGFCLCGKSWPCPEYAAIEKERP